MGQNNWRSAVSRPQDWVLNFLTYEKKSRSQPTGICAGTDSTPARPGSFNLKGALFSLDTRRAAPSIDPSAFVTPGDRTDSIALAFAQLPVIVSKMGLGVQEGKKDTLLPSSGRGLTLRQTRNWTMFLERYCSTMRQRTQRPSPKV